MPTPSTDQSLFARITSVFRHSRHLREILDEHYIPYSRIGTRTVARYRCELGRWEKLVGDLPIERIAESHFLRFRQQCQLCGLANSSTEGSVKVVKLLLKFARDRGWITRLPIFGRPLPIEEPEPEPATLDELGRLYTAAESAVFPGRGTISPCDWMRAFVVLEYWTGLRGQDLIWQFEWRHIREDCIKFRASKTGKRHVFPLHPTVMRHLSLVHGSHETRVLGVRSLNRVNDQLARMSAAAGIRKLTTTHIREACFTQWTLADETSGKLIHGCGIPRVLRRHYLGRLQILQASAERVRWFPL